jgi:hypothetical protein
MRPSTCRVSCSASPSIDAAALFLWGHALNTLDLSLTQPGRVVLGPKWSAPADGGSEWDEFTNAFKTVAVLVTRRGVQGDTWPLLELFEDKIEEPIQGHRGLARALLEAGNESQGQAMG